MIQNNSRDVLIEIQKFFEYSKKYFFYFFLFNFRT
jgi:hypothetical protein